jgi:uridine phosphorylase
MLTQDSLIINDDGSVYHLGLRPEQIAEKVIFVGDPERVPKVSQHFDRIEHIVQRREFITHTGYIGKMRISVLSTGMGTDNIDIVLNELDILWNIDFETRTYKQKHTRGLILRLGTTGALQESVQIGDFVLSNYAIGMDNLGHYYSRYEDMEIQKHFESWCKEQNIYSPFMPYFTQGNVHFNTYITQRMSCITGITMTNPGFYAPQNRLLRSVSYPLSHFVDRVAAFCYQGNAVLNMEMETAGILALSRHLGHVSASLSVVLAHRKKNIFATNPNANIKQLIESGIIAITQYDIKNI